MYGREYIEWLEGDADLITSIRETAAHIRQEWLSFFFERLAEHRRQKIVNQDRDLWSLPCG